MKRFVLIGALVLAGATAQAEEQPPCADSLQIEKMHAYLLGDHREKLELQVAQWRYAVYVEQQKRKALETELADLKKKLLEQKAP